MMGFSGNQRSFGARLVARHCLLVTSHLLFILLLFSPALLFATQEAGPHIESKTKNYDIKRITISNGIKVIHIERHELPIVAINLLIRAGSKHEPPEKAGLASFTGKMLLEGTKTMDASQISETIEHAGASLHVETDYDYTIISLYVLKKNLFETFKVFRDIVLNPVFPKKEFIKQKAIYLRSLQKNEEEPSYIAMKVLRKGLFKDAPYSRPVNGITETVENISRKDLVDFYTRTYSPQGAILVIAGDVTEEELNLLLMNFKDWEKDSVHSDLKSEASLNSPETTQKTVIIDRDLTQANILYGFPGISRKDPDYYTASVLNYILGGGGFGSRLMKKIREEMGLAYDVSSSFTINEEPGLFVISLQTRNDQAYQAIEIIKQEIQRLTREPVSDEELQEAKAYLTGSLVRRLDTTQKLADFFTLVEFYGLGEDYIQKYPEYINRVTKDDIIRFAKRLLSQEGIIVIVGKRSEINGHKDQ